MRIIGMGGVGTRRVARGMWHVVCALWRVMLVSGVNMCSVFCGLWSVVLAVVAVVVGVLVIPLLDLPT